MSEQSVQLPDTPAGSTGKRIRVIEQTIAGVTVETQTAALADPTDPVAIAAVRNTDPAGTDFGVVVRVVPAAGGPALPAGAATSAKQDAGNVSLASMLSALSSVLAALQGTLTTSAASLPLPAGAATQATLAGVLAALQSALTVGPVSGTVTANAGSNLNTSALALEAGNLAALVAKDFATQTTLAAILAKLITAPATETTLAAVLAKLITAPATETTLAALSGKIPALGGAAASASLPVVTTIAGVTYTDRSGTITAGGTAQQMAAANALRKGFFIQNNSTSDLWMSSVTTAVLSQPSVKVPAGALYESPANGVPVTAISIVGATSAQAFSAREW